MFADFLERWPTLPAAQRARRETLERFFRSANVRRAATIERRIGAIHDEQPLHSDEAVITPARMLVEALLPQLRELSASIARFDTEIARLTDKLPDYALFEALPGAGPTLAPRLMAAFGERRERFAGASAAQKCFGIAPVIEAKWQQVLGPLALRLQQIPAANVRRVGRSNHPPLVLGEGLLRLLPRSRHPPPSCAASPGLQVDPHPLPLLGRPHPLR